MEDNKPYTKFWNAWMAVEKMGRSPERRQARCELLQKVDRGEFGKQVRFSVFGLGSYDEQYDNSRERLQELNREMKFYAELER